MPNQLPNKLQQSLQIMRMMLTILWLTLLGLLLIIALYAIGEGLFIYIKGPSYFPTRFMLRTWLQHLPFNPWQSLPAQTVHQLQLPLALAIFALAALFLWFFITHHRKITHLTRQIAQLKQTQASLEASTLERLLRKWNYDQRQALDKALMHDQQTYQQRIQQLQHQHQQLISQLNDHAMQNNQALMSWQESQQQALRRLLQEWLLSLQTAQEPKSKAPSLTLDVSPYQVPTAKAKSTAEDDA